MFLNDVLAKVLRNIKLLDSETTRGEARRIVLAIKPHMISLTKYARTFSRFTDGGILVGVGFH